jgi:hypothetical protein
MKEVAYKEKSISEHPKRERRKLEEDSIKVVAGPGGQLFITDHHHHHGARSMCCTRRAIRVWLGSLGVGVR